MASIQYTFGVNALFKKHCFQNKKKALKLIFFLNSFKSKYLKLSKQIE